MPVPGVLVRVTVDDVSERGPVVVPERDEYAGHVTVSPVANGATRNSNPGGRRGIIVRCFVARLAQ